MFSKFAYSIFEQSIKDYHVYDNVDQAINNPYPKDKIEHLLYFKNWIDTVQWHFEDIIRDPKIDPVAALTLKRRIVCFQLKNVPIWWNISTVIFFKNMLTFL